MSWRTNYATSYQWAAKGGRWGGREGIFRDGRDVTVRGDYILGSYHRYFYNASVREPIVSTYHQMILSDIRGCRTQNNQRYHKCINTYPIGFPKRGIMREEGAEFIGLLKEAKNDLYPREGSMDLGGDLVIRIPVDSPKTAPPRGPENNSHGDQ